MMDLEMNALGFTAMSVEQLGELLQLAVLFLQANGLKIGLTIVTVDRDGMRTLGNLPPHTQREAFKALIERMDSPDDVQEMTGDGKTHATH